MKLLLALRSGRHVIGLIQTSESSALAFCRRFKRTRHMYNQPLSVGCASRGWHFNFTFLFYTKSLAFFTHRRLQYISSMLILIISKSASVQKAGQGSTSTKPSVSTTWPMWWLCAKPRVTQPHEAECRRHACAKSITTSFGFSVGCCIKVIELAIKIQEECSQTPSQLNDLLLCRQ